MSAPTRSPTPANIAVRGGLVDLFPSGEEQALRLDFFGDEIESVRRFDPATQRSIDRIDGFTLLPASETLLDEDSVKRFRSAYRELFGATATGDPLYQAVSDGRRIAGIDHWLPLFEERLATLFDHLADDDLIVRDPRRRRRRRGALRGDRRLLREPRSARRPSEPGSYRPLAPETLYLGARGMGRRSSRRGRSTSSRRSTSPRARRVHRLRGRAGPRFRARAGAGRQRLRSGGRPCRRPAAQRSARSCSPAIRPARASG